MLTLRLAIKNILGTGIRSWLNAAVIAIALMAAVWNQSILTGVDEQVSQAAEAEEYGGGQLWHEEYDPYDPLALERAHASLPPVLQDLVREKKATPILVIQGAIFPRGRMHTVLLKGIDPAQSMLTFPSQFLAASMESSEIPALIGTRMVKATGLGLNDITTLRWREPGGSFNALDIRIVQVMNTTVASIDQNQIWLPLAKLQAMARLPQEATLLVVSRAVQSPPALSGWSFKNLDFLLQELREMIKTKGYGRTFLFSILMAMGLLAIFDTQVLAIFRRRKEIGTLIALGFTRGQVIRLFTLEGALYGVLAVILGTILGTPLLVYQAKSGLSLPAGTEDFGFAISEKIFPVYSAGLILGTVLIALLAITVVSLLPTRRIAKMKPTDALRGRTS